VSIEWHRLRPAEVLAAAAGLLLAVALFLPWFEIGGVREDAWNALTVAEIPSALAALGALCLVVATVTRPSPAIPLAVAVATAVVALVAVIAVAIRAADPPAAATDRCYGLWLALGGSVAVLVAAALSLRDERPAWGVPVTG
jgi:hypothetical protein